MRKVRKSLAILLAAAMVLTMAPAIVFGAGVGQVVRIAGGSRYDTSAQTALDAFPNGAETVIIARGDNEGGFADGLAASYLAKVKNAPILLTSPAGLSDKVKDAIVTLGANKAIVLGGTIAVSANVEAELKAQALDVERINGANRNDTAAKIASKGSNVDTALVVSGSAPADSLVAGPLAFTPKTPILLVNKDSVPAETTSVIAELGIKNIHVIGGTGVVSEAVYKKLGAKARYCGQSRIETSLDVAKKLFASPKNFSIVGYLNLADAVGAAVYGNPILYVNDGISHIESLLSSDSQTTIFGGTLAVSEKVENKLKGKDEGEAPIRFEKIKPVIKILEPDSIGTVYMEATYINNSPYPITGYDLKVLLKDKNEITYLSTYDTVMPGETSPKFDSFGPQTQNTTDYEILGLSVYARKDNGKTLAIDYDFKLNEATWFEYEQQVNDEDEAPIRFEKIKPVIKILEPDSIGTVYMEATYINNSPYPITGYDLKVLLKDKNEITYLSTYDTVMPGETSPKFDSFGPQTQNTTDYEILGLSVYARKDNGKTLAIDYDFKLNEATWFEYEEQL